MTTSQAGSARDRERLLRVARRRLAGGQRPSVDQLAREAGLSRAAFYRLFRSRAALLAELALPPERGPRERVLEAASELVLRDGLGKLSMDEVAERAGLSRAALYRTFPGKPALFNALVLAHSPLEPIVDLLTRRGGEAPEELLPDLAAMAVGVVGANRALILSLITELTSLQPDAEEAIRESLARGFGTVAGYLTGRMLSGDLRPLPAPVAFVSLAGPMLLLGLASPVFQRLGLEVVPETTARELAAFWLRAMRVEIR